MLLHLVPARRTLRQVDMTKGNAIFLAGAVLEIIGLHLGVSSSAVAWSLLLYGAVLLATGYVS